MFMQAGDNARPVRCKLKNWYDGPAVKKLSEELYGEAEGSHATPSEVSLTRFAYPDSIKRAPMSPEIAPKGPIHDAADYRRRFPDGRMGSDPSLATPEIGKRLFDAAVKELSEEWRKYAA